ncbi:MAG: PTH1 family peptidyl-tRNA hydrolase [Planctomycetota bacterium]
MAKKSGVVFRKANEFFMVAEIQGGWLVKPLTYVNRSGQVIDLLLAEEWNPEGLMVVVDDLNLDVGRLRIRPKGSDGGHNGLKDIARALGSSNYPRIRIGVSRHGEEGMKEHVLGAFDESEEEEILGVVQRAGQAIEDFFSGESVNVLMRNWNGS